MALVARQEVAPPSAVKLHSPSRLSNLLEKESVVITLLLVWGVLVYGHHLGTALGDTESIYASIARRIVRTHEWLPLVYEGQPYLNKPPLHFWLMAVSFLLWGPSEFAVRFPSATFGLGTMLLVYYSGKVLFHRRLALFAALILATTFAGVWDAHRGMIDVEVGFWINVAFFAFYLAYRRGGRRFGYLSLAFVSMAVGTMLKGLVALLLPGGAAFAYLVITRRSKVFREIPFLLAGLAIFLFITVPYYLGLGAEFNRHFFLDENLMRIFRGSKPRALYFYVVFADFFPWSLFLPCAILSLLTSRSRRLGEEEDVALRVWSISFFLLLNLPAAKAERFLTFLLPAFALLVARYWDNLLSYGSAMIQTGEVRLLRFSAALLGLGTGVALFVGPLLVRTRFRVPANVLPMPFALAVGAGCAAVIFTAWRSRPYAIFSSVLALGMALTFGLVQFFYPALGRYDSAIPISHQIRSKVGDSSLVIFHPRGPFKEEILYYLDLPYPVQQIKTAEKICMAFRTERRVFALLTKDHYGELTCPGERSIRLVADYPYRRWHYVLVSNEGQS